MGFKLRVKVAFPSSNDKPADKVIKGAGAFRRDAKFLARRLCFLPSLELKELK